jgi:hypothetical protein
MGGMTAVRRGAAAWPGSPGRLMIAHWFVKARNRSDGSAGNSIRADAQDRSGIRAVAGIPVLAEGAAIGAVNL